MTRSNDPELPTSIDAMLGRTRRRAQQLRRRRRLLVGGAAAAVIAAAIAVPLVVVDHHSTHVVNVVGGSSSPTSVRPGSPATGPTTGPTPGPAATSAPAATTSPATAPTTSVPTTSAPTASAPTTSAPVPTTVGSRPVACATSNLRATLAGGSGAAGSVGYELTLRNIGSKACTLFGYPGVSYVTGPAGTIVGAPARRDAVTPVATVTIAPQHAAQATLIETDSLNYPPATCRLTTVAGLRIYPPNQTASLFVPQTTRACANPADPGLQIGAVEVAPSTGG